MQPTKPARGDVWLVRPYPTHDHCFGALRPVLIISDNRLQQGHAGMLVTVPLGDTDRQQPLHVPIPAPNVGAGSPCFARCDQPRTVSSTRLARFLGRVSPTTMAQVEERLRRLLGL